MTHAESSYERIAELQHAFDAERAAVLATAVGIARMRIRMDQPLLALEALDSAAAETGRLHRRFLRECGYSDEAIDGLLPGVLFACCCCPSRLREGLGGFFM